MKKEGLEKIEPLLFPFSYNYKLHNYKAGLSV